MWCTDVGRVDALSYIIVITVLRVFSPIAVGIQRIALIGRVTHPVVECVPRSHVRYCSNLTWLYTCGCVAMVIVSID